MKSCRLSVALRPSTLFSFVLAALLTFALVPHLAFGQQTLGSLSGTVTDPSGAVVQKATVKIRDVATNLVVMAESKNDGSFSAAAPPIGTYEVTFTKDVNYLRESNRQVENVYAIEKAGGFNGKGSPEAFDFTTHRLAAGSQMLLDLWYTAWLDSAISAEFASGSTGAQPTK